MTTLRQPRVALGWMVFLLIAVAGLFYVKWFPYYNRAFVAASQHSIGKSILMGTSASAPEPSWQAALDYAMGKQVVSQLPVPHTHTVEAIRKLGGHEGKAIQQAEAKTK